VVLTLGDAVEVEVTAVDEDLRRISAWLIEAHAQDEHGKTFTFVPTLAGPARLGEGDLEKPRAGRFEGRVGGERGRREDRPTGRPPRKVREAEGRPAKGRAPKREARPKPPRPTQERRPTAGEARDPEEARPRKGRVKGSVRGSGKRKGR
jgi:ribonuclease R